MNDNAKELLPAKGGLPYSDDLSSALARCIEDDIEDAEMLRSWRKPVAIAMIAIAAVFYAVLFGVIGCLFFCDAVAQRILAVPTLAAAVIAVLAAVPTLILVCVARAFFGKHGAAEVSYPQLLASLRRMKKEP